MTRVKVRRLAPGLQRTAVSSLALLGLFLCSLASAVDDSDGLSVVTGTQTTYSLTYALLQNTGIETVNIPEDGRRLSSLKSYIERRKERFDPIFKAADAVVAFTNVIGSDPLYRFARESNIQLIYVDAAQPWGYGRSGVSLVDKPATDVPWATESASEHGARSNYFWLSISNAIRMADIIGTDLARIFPEFTDRITRNMDNLKAELQNLGRKYQTKLLETQDISVFALASEFVYLTNDMGLFVDGYFIKQDINWTDEDLRKLTVHLKSRNIRVVLHKWEPSDAIKTSIEKAGANVVVLDTGDPGMSVDRKLVSDGYQQILRNNLDALASSLVK